MFLLFLYHISLFYLMQNQLSLFENQLFDEHINLISLQNKAINKQIDIFNNDIQNLTDNIGNRLREIEEKSIFENKLAFLYIAVFIFLLLFSLKIY